MAAITLSGVNGIDFNTIINAVMQSESKPLQDLQTQQQALQNRDSAMVSLAGIISSLQTPVAALTSTTSFSNVAATSTDTSVGTVTLGQLALSFGLMLAVLAAGMMLFTRVERTFMDTV